LHLIAAAIGAAMVNAASGTVDEPRFEFAVRAGFGGGTGEVLPLGSGGASNTPKLDRAVPLWMEAGYHLGPALVLGGYFQYAFGRVDPGAMPANLCSVSSCSGSGHIVRIGGELQYRFLTDATLVPWAGVGAGYSSRSERVGIAGFTQPGGFNIGPASLTSTTWGLDLNLQTGADARLNSWCALGPYVSFFTGVSATVEGGLRARFRL
jgi:hypothetical protein